MDASADHGNKYAVLFRTHFWDDYAERQYNRLRSVVRGGDVFIVVDETNRPVPVPHDNVVRHTQDEMLALGLSGGGHGNMLWFNGDYPLYHFFQRHGGYEYYVMSEYDVVVQRSLDDVIARAAAARADFIGLTKGEAVAEWPLVDTCRDAYAEDQIRKRLICIAAFSHRAVRRLFDRRLEQSRQQRDGALRRWPYCEGYIPTELAASGMTLMELSEFGGTERYDWKPAILEAELPALADQAFLHPVLDTPRFIQHTMKDLWPPEAFFDPRNPVARRLRRAPVGAYGPKLAQALWRRARAAVRTLSPGPGRA